jgi:hypothetical protein
MALITAAEKSDGAKRFFSKMGGLLIERCPKVHSVN